MLKKTVEFQRSIAAHDLRERKVQMISATEWKTGILEGYAEERGCCSFLVALVTEFLFLWF